MRAANPLGLAAPFVCALLFAACTNSTTPAPSPTHAAPPELTAPYAAAARSGARVYRLDPDASQVLIFVGKSGALSGLGHEHVIRVARLRGFALIEPNGRARADLLFPATGLEVDPPATRKALGNPWSKHQPDTDSRHGTRHNMLGPDVLDAARYPRVHLVVTANLSPSPGKRTIATAITLHGVTRALDTPIDPHRTNRTVSVNGRFKIKQTDFGIAPYSALLGALRVKNTLGIRYHLVLASWCPPRPDPSCSTPP